MIYIDNIKKYKASLWCHMITGDTLEELHLFAKQIKVGRHRFDANKKHPHYDLKPDEFTKAIEFGAKLVTSKELVEICQKNSY